MPAGQAKVSTAMLPGRKRAKKMNTSDLFAAHLVFLLPLTQTGIEY
jgi:hypothetical protein